MFFFRETQKEYYSCEYLEKGMNFDVKGIYHCCPNMGANENVSPVVDSNVNPDKGYFEFFKQKEELRRNAQKGKLNGRCKNCFLLKKIYWDSDNTISRINIFANKTCSLNCVYCETYENKEYYNSFPDMPVYGYISLLIEERKIADNCNVLFAGGEPTQHFEFEKNMNLLLNKGVFIRVNTSAINYSVGIENAIKRGNSSVVVSIDSGTADLYKKIKGVDKFSLVVENLSKYCNAQFDSNCFEQVMLKYIVIPDVNDKEEYIVDFFQLVKKINCRIICVDLEYFWSIKNQNNIEKMRKMLDFIDYFKIKSKEFGLKCL